MHFASFFIAGLSSTGQNVVWFTDEDEFVPDNVAVTNATTLFGHISSHYLGEQLGHLRFGTTECDDGSRMIEDFVAIPDLAAGMITEYLDKSKKDNTIPTSRILRPITNTLSQKSKALFTWFGDDTKPLKRAALRLWGENNSFRRFGWIMFHGTTDDDQIEWEFKKLQTPLKAQP